MDGQQTTRGGNRRDGSGRFAPGCSGNPAGKRKGTRNRATLLAAALRDGEGEAAARTIIDKAVSGDAVAARFCLTLLSPRPRGRAIALDLPDGARPADVDAAYDVTLAAMAAGEITPDEALIVTKVLDGRLRALEACRREARRAARDGVDPGAAAMADDPGKIDDAAAEPPRLASRPAFSLHLAASLRGSASPLALRHAAFASPSAPLGGRAACIRPAFAGSAPLGGARSSRPGPSHPDWAELYASIAS
jgi:hypothetical protein